MTTAGDSIFATAKPTVASPMSTGRCEQQTRARAPGGRQTSLGKQQMFVSDIKLGSLCGEQLEVKNTSKMILSTTTTGLRLKPLKSSHHLHHLLVLLVLILGLSATTPTLGLNVQQQADQQQQLSADAGAGNGAGNQQQSSSKNQHLHEILVAPNSFVRIECKLPQVVANGSGKFYWNFQRSAVHGQKPDLLCFQQECIDQSSYGIQLEMDQASGAYDLIISNASYELNDGIYYCDYRDTSTESRARREVRLTVLSK